MVNPGPPWPPLLVAEALGTGSIPAELSAILVAHFRTVRKDGAALLAEKRLGRGIHSFLAQMASGLDPVHRLYRVTLAGVELDIMVHLMHSLFSVRVNIYSAI